MVNVHISNQQILQEKIKSLQSAGSTNFHVVADFDKTLTKAFVRGKKILSSYSLLRDGGYLTPDYPRRAYAEFDKYHPYEIDPNLSIEEKDVKMVEWWKAHWDLMLECGMNKGVIEDLIVKRKLELRGSVEKLFGLLNKNTIPLLIFSSGLGNVIEEFLKDKMLLTPNIHIIANFFQFNDKGIAIDYKKPLIHVFNKNEVEVKNTPYYQEVSERKNVILLGDSLGDLGMTEGLEHDTIIRIGFLNDNTKELLNKYSKEFDVVILNDGSMSYVNELIKEILGVLG